MPSVNIKLVKQQVTPQQKQLLIKGLMDIIVKVMSRNPELTVITIDEIDQSNWFIGGKSIDKSAHDNCINVEIKISKGTSSAEEMSEVIQSGKDMVASVLGSCDKTNYIIINELNPDAWGFEGISMTVRNKMDQL